MKTAILYTRVAKYELGQGKAKLRHQEFQLKEYCRKNQIKILKLYSEDCSGSTFNRPEIKRMLSSFMIQENRPDFVLFTSWDRFSRNTGNTYEMIKILAGFGVEPKAIEQPLNMTLPENHLMPAFYITALPAKHIKNGLKKSSTQQKK